MPSPLTSASAAEASQLLAYPVLPSTKPASVNVPSPFPNATSNDPYPERMASALLSAFMSASVTESTSLSPPAPMNGARKVPSPFPGRVIR